MRMIARLGCAVGLLVGSSATAQPTPAPEPPLAATEPSEPSALASFNGFFVTTDDGAYQLRVGGLVQADGRFFLGEEEPPNTFVIRRTRLDLRATVAKYFKFRLHPEFSNSSLNLLDAYATVALVDEVQLTVGKQKTPVGLELLQSPTTMNFPERGLPSALVPNRDVGVVLSGDIAKFVSYSVGAFNGVAGARNTEQDDNTDKDIVGRVFLTPFAPTTLEPLQQLGVGVSGSWGEQVVAQPVHRSSGRRNFFQFNGDVVADGARARVSPQAYWFFGPIGLLGEYVLVREALTDGVTQRAITQTAWQVWGSFILGGHASYRGPKLRTTLNPAAGTWGALEVAARVGQLAVDDVAFDTFADIEFAARAATNIAGSLSWWVAPGSRAMLAYDFTTYDGGAANGSDRNDEHVLVARLQIGF